MASVNRLLQDDSRLGSVSCFQNPSDRVTPKLAATGRLLSVAILSGDLPNLGETGLMGLEENGIAVNISNDRPKAAILNTGLFSQLAQFATGRKKLKQA